MKINIIDMPNGLLCETVYYGKYHRKLYVGYTKREAKRLFAEYVKEEEGKYFYNQKKAVWRNV